MRFSKMLIAFLALLLFLGNGSVAAEPARFTDLGKGTVLDSQTGLMWQKGDSYHDLKKGMNWYEALEYIDKKNTEKYSGFSDWRLPEIEEIMKILELDVPVKIVNILKDERLMNLLTGNNPIHSLFSP